MPERRVSHWYFGGLASAAAACNTHPLDLLKVQLQTQQGAKDSVVHVTMKIVRQHGLLALYNGLSASLLRQLTYSTTRFGIYDVAKKAVAARYPGQAITFGQMTALAALAGAAGGIVGTPADLVNVRMQNDIKLPAEQRRNYRHAADGLVRVFREEGVRRLFGGGALATCRAVLMTVGQLTSYDVVKGAMLRRGHKDEFATHLTSSLTAGLAATTMTQPVDVLKTRMMTAKPGEFKGLIDLFWYTAKLGPLGFFKGFLPASARIGPQTILTFLFIEQLNKMFGMVVL